MTKGRMASGPLHILILKALQEDTQVPLFILHVPEIVKLYSLQDLSPQAKELELLVVLSLSCFLESSSYRVSVLTKLASLELVSTQSLKPYPSQGGK